MVSIRQSYCSSDVPLGLGMIPDPRKSGIGDLLGVMGSLQCLFSRSNFRRLSTRVCELVAPRLSLRDLPGGASGPSSSGFG